MKDKKHIKEIKKSTSLHYLRREYLTLSLEDIEGDRGKRLQAKIKQLEKDWKYEQTK